MLQTEEKDYKILLIKQLNSINNGWVDGDKEIKKGKKVDIVNHNLKFAIEIKDDTKSGEKSQDLKLGNKQYANRIKLACDKFYNYSNYKTLLIFRTEYPVAENIYYEILGLHRYVKNTKNQLVYSGRVSKCLPCRYEQIGGFLIYSCPPKPVVAEYYYYPNSHALSYRKINRKEINNILKII